MAGEWDKVEGEVKEKAGDVTGDRSGKAEGKAQNAWGEVQDRADEAKEGLEERRESQS